MKKRGGRLSQVRRLREQRYPHIVRANTCICGKTIPRQSLPRVGKVASGASRIGQWRYERAWEIVTSASFTRASERRCAVPLPRRGRQRGGGFAAPKGSQPRLAALGSPFQGKGLAWILPPSYGRRCPEGAEVGWGKRYEKERERSSQVRRLLEHPLYRCAVPLLQWGRLRRYENAAFLALSERIHAYVEKRITTDKAFPAWGRWRAKRDG